MPAREPKARDLTAADLPAAVSLSAGVGWNQVAADWRVFVDHGHVTALDDEEGRLAATAAILPFGPELAWISMVIVRPDQRGRGLATRLLERCVGEVRATGRTPGLDATPAGRPVYLRLGFEDCFTLTRWRRSAPAVLAPSVPLRGLSVRSLEPGDWPRIEALDRQAFGSDRAFLLRGLGARAAGFAAVGEDEAGRLVGFVLGRDGRTAAHLGPLVAGSEEVALALAAHVVAHLADAVTIDVADRFAGVARWLAASGFTMERPFTRMYHERSVTFGDPGHVIAIAGPELG